MLKFKRKMLPQPQLLRWLNWFSQWSFDDKHIKGKYNILADFFSKPPAPPIQMVSLIISYIFPLEPTPALETLPEEVKSIILEKLLATRSI